MPTVPGVVIREVRELCVAANLRVLTVPGLEALLSGRVTVSHLRHVQIEDLLRREPVHTDQAGIRQHLASTVLVTGAGGSIGAELCRQIARLEVPELILLGHGENSIFAIENELREQYPALRLRAVIADVRDLGRIDAVFARFRPGAVFHAAAHKHVPLMEANPEEAVTNNVGGTRTVLAAAERWETAHFVLVSTDKAVRPTNVMGMSKRLAEELVRASAVRTGRNFVSVRFGNVLGSRGSVIPTFQAQIAAGGPVRVTDPGMTRYFMTIPEAVQLLLQAVPLGRGGETFVLDMGQPVRIVDLARDLIELSGLEVDRDIRIEFTGLRPGEKLFEELFFDSEHHCRTVHQKIFVARAAAGPGLPDREMRLLIRAAEAGDMALTGKLLRGLVASLEQGAGGQVGIPLRALSLEPETLSIQKVSS
jgi:FlaA1/EpsC-like NDP-sugar epimerase